MSSGKLRVESGKQRIGPCLAVVVILILCLGSVRARADRFADAATRSLGPLVVLGEVSLLSDGQAGKSEALQGAKALAVTAVLTEAMKRIVREKRPNSNELTSFPSGHASIAFAMATVVADYQPEYKWLAYGAATTISWSRVKVEAHHWQDVVAGAALGYAVAKRYTGQDLVVTPGGVAYQWKF